MAILSIQILWGLLRERDHFALREEAWICVRNTCIGSGVFFSPCDMFSRSLYVYGLSGNVSPTIFWFYGFSSGTWVHCSSSYQLQTVGYLLWSELGCYLDTMHRHFRGQGLETNRRDALVIIEGRGRVHICAKYFKWSLWLPKYSNRKYIYEFIGGDWVWAPRQRGRSSSSSLWTLAMQYAHVPVSLVSVP